MNSQLFFLLNLVFGVLLIAWFLSSRRDGGSRPPTRLNLRKGSPQLPPGPLELSTPKADDRSPAQRPKNTPLSEQELEAMGLFDSSSDRGSAPQPISPPPGVRPRGKMPEPMPRTSTSEVSGRETKNLNVLFMYNGHDWDAYEVLGVPAGAGLPTVTARYQELIRGADKGQLEFYEAAYQAILKR